MERAVGVGFNPLTRIWVIRILWKPLGNQQIELGFNPLTRRAGLNIELVPLPDPSGSGGDTDPP